MKRLWLARRQFEAARLVFRLAEPWFRAVSFVLKLIHYIGFMGHRWASTKKRHGPFPLRPLFKIHSLTSWVYSALSRTVGHLPWENRPCTRTRLRKGEIDPGSFSAPKAPSLVKQKHSSSPYINRTRTRHLSLGLGGTGW